MFERTRSGQNNRAIFYGVDYVCFVEGGGGIRDSGPDITFWSSIFSFFRPDLKIRCIPKGGKPILQSIAKDLIVNNVQSTLVAMDSDYDDFRGVVIFDRRVLYSYGYSWENDVLWRKNLHALYAAICHCGEIPVDVVDEFDRGIERLSIRLKRPVHADFFALCAGTSVLPRPSPGRVISHDQDGWPIVRLDQVLQLIKQANTSTRIRPIPLHGGPPTETFRYCVGKIIAHSMFLLTKALIRMHHSKRNLSPDYFRDMSLQTFRESLIDSDDEPMVQHHRSQCELI